ncbi:hypothetical protein HMPREF1980_01659 [Actinomyces sp. oral taxon 172 str. F0311]|nr:hypothetical protein HMPREF1980_01659 [Actinomyces sp. oral taxon 172 str. F0311]
MLLMFDGDLTPRLVCRRCARPWRGRQGRRAAPRWRDEAGGGFLPKG